MGIEIAKELVIALPLAIIGIYGVQAMVRNDYATGVIDDKRDSINELLKPYGVKVHVLAYNDCAPCSAEHTVVKGAEKGLPSRIFLRHMKRIKACEMTVSELIEICEKIESKYQQKVAQSREL